MDKNGKSQQKNPRVNVLEALKEIGTHSAKTIGSDLIKETGNEFVNQIFGKFPKKHYSGEIIAGEQLVVQDVFSGKHEEDENSKKQILVERTLIQEEKVLMERKSNELRLELNAIVNEIQLIAQATPKLMQEIEFASIQAPVDPGQYHLVFFEKLLEFIKSFRKKIEHASVWLGATNKRAQKKNYWTKYKKHGGKFLLSSEHYLQRSAG